jgi:hypothetical protein
MNAAQFLSLPRWPARLNVEQTAAILGCAGHDIPILVRSKMLVPLGNPAANAPKYFATVEVEALAQDRAWLHKATQAIARYWRQKNGRHLPATQESKDSNSRATASAMPVVTA